MAVVTKTRIITETRSKRLVDVIKAHRIYINRKINFAHVAKELRITRESFRTLWLAHSLVSRGLFRKIILKNFTSKDIHVVV